MGPILMTFFVSIYISIHIYLSISIYIYIYIYIHLYKIYLGGNVLFWTVCLEVHLIAVIAAWIKKTKFMITPIIIDVELRKNVSDA